LDEKICVEGDPLINITAGGQEKVKKKSVEEGA